MKCIVLSLILAAGATIGSLSAAELQTGKIGREFDSEIDKAFHKLRYSAQDQIAAFSYSEKSTFRSADLSDQSLGFDDGVGNSSLSGRKSVLKAGILSILIPGLGQVYNGSHIGKVALFAGAEIGTILGAKKFNNDGDETVKEFEAIALANWSEQDYWDYLNQVYGDTTDADDNFGDPGGHGHHLPNTHTQQYFEMVGKYDQFSYGWARAEGHGAAPGETTDTSFVWDPSTDRYANRNRFPSPKRIAYNNLRADANTSFDSRDRMVIFTILNHVVSSIDAVVSANRHNRKLEGADGGLSFHPSIRRDENWGLIPEVKLSLKF